MEDLESSSRIEFHGVEYVVTVAVQRQELFLQVEVDPDQPQLGKEPPSDTCTCWTGQFSASYVEELTRKTGNSKRFAVFVNMLLTALARRSDAVFIDLLTSADLELYRKRKLGKAAANDSFDGSLGASVSVAGAVASNATSSHHKRYLILTYVVEFDRVHYPLPLTLTQTPTVEMLQRTIRRLRQSLVDAKSENNMEQLLQEVASLREENRCLQNTLKRYCTEERAGNGEDDDPNQVVELRKELEASVRQNKELLVIYQQLRDESTREVARLQSENKQLKLAGPKESESVVSQRNLDQELARRKISDANAALQDALAQLKQSKAQMKEVQLKNRELMRQLAIARAKAGPLHANHASTTANDGYRGVSGATARQQSATVTVGAARPARHAPYDDASDEDNNRMYRTPRLQSHQRTKSAPNSAPIRAAPGQRPAFRRFDPTAYQQERQRKLQARSRSPGRPLPRTRADSNAGYTSDSSAGGYSSADSNGSRKSTRSRGRSSVSYARQREVSSRLASPKGTPPLPQSSSRTRFRSPAPRSAPADSTRRTRSPSPNAQRRPPAAERARGSAGRRSPATRTRGKSPAPVDKAPVSAPLRKQRAISKPTALLADTSIDSFSDIDDRLNALQQFLKEAKTGGNGSTASVTQAGGPR